MTGTQAWVLLAQGSMSPPVGGYGRLNVSFRGQLWWKKPASEHSKKGSMDTSCENVRLPNGFMETKAVQDGGHHPDGTIFTVAHDSGAEASL